MTLFEEVDARVRNKIALLEEKIKIREKKHLEDMKILSDINHGYPYITAISSFVQLPNYFDKWGKPHNNTNMGYHGTNFIQSNTMRSF